MNEEKLYVVKNDEGEYLDIDLPIWWDDKAGSAFKRIDLALRWAKKYDGHVVTLIEEPEKVVLTKEQADCPYCHDPFLDFSGLTDDELDWKQEAFCSVDENRHIFYGSFGDGYDGESKTIIINYCPMCGRKLGEDE